LSGAIVRLTAFDFSLLAQFTSLQGQFGNTASRTKVLGSIGRGSGTHETVRGRFRFNILEPLAPIS
jgi:hypothetical protein